MSALGLDLTLSVASIAVASMSVKLIPIYDRIHLFCLCVCSMFILLCFSKGFLVFEIRKNHDLRKILVTPKIFLKSKAHCISIGDIGNLFTIPTI